MATEAEAGDLRELTQVGDGRGLVVLDHGLVHLLLGVSSPDATEVERVSFRA